MDLRSVLATQAYGTIGPGAATQDTSQAAKVGTGLGQMAEDFVTTLQRGEETAKAAMTDGADPHALVQALAQTELAIETAVTLRNKVVEAYQEILRMPI